MNKFILNYILIVLINFCHASHQSYVIMSPELVGDQWQIKKSNPTEFSASEEQWHRIQGKRLEEVKKLLQEVKPDSWANIATFRINVKNKEKSFSKDFSNFFFISGGDKNLIDQLYSKKERLEFDDINFKCIADYCPLQSNKPADFGLRKEITDFFGLKEKLNPLEKSHLSDVFRTCLQDGRVAFDEIILTEKAINKLTDTYQATLEGRFFTPESKNRVSHLKFIDKTEKAEEVQNIDNLFGKNLQLNFADSEQTIRLFIHQLAASREPDWKLSEPMENIISLLKVDDCKSFDQFDKNIKELKQRQIAKDDIDQIQGKIDNIQNPIKELITKYIADNIEISIDIASYYDMCANCQATFSYDILEKKQLQKSIFAVMIKDIKDKKDVRRAYLIYCLLRNDDKSDQTGLLSIPKISILTSSLKDYAREPEGKEL